MSDLSCSVRARPETTAEIARHRIGVTASIITAAVGLSYLLGRRR